MMASSFFKYKPLARIQLGIHDAMRHASARIGQYQPLRYFEPMLGSAFRELIPFKATTSMLDTF